MTIVAYYYQINLTRNSLTSKTTEAREQGITESEAIHENPQYKVSPDQTYGVARIHFDDEDPTQDRGLYEAETHVVPITQQEASDLVSSWVE